jgi:hypothetical protein
VYVCWDASAGVILCAGHHLWYIPGGDDRIGLLLPSMLRNIAWGARLGEERDMLLHVYGKKCSPPTLLDALVEGFLKVVEMCYRINKVAIQYNINTTTTTTATTPFQRQRPFCRAPSHIRSHILSDTTRTPACCPRPQAMGVLLFPSSINGPYTRRR